MLGAAVVVIGDGIARSAAALAAIRKGAEVVLLTKLSKKAGLARTAGGLKKGILKVGALEKEFEATGPGRTVFEGALADPRSRGCHFRLDVEEEVALADLP